MTSKGSLLPKISQYFLNKFRVTLLIVLGVILFGYVAYTTLINKQGFPAASVPLVLINGSYQVNDINRVDKEITSDLEGIVRELDIVNGVNSTTSANTFNLSVNLNSGTEVDKGL